MLLAKIGNKKFISAAVSSVKLKYAKSIFKDGYYFEFLNNKEHYPLELAFTQFQSLKNYELVFIEEINNKGFLGVFLKDLNRKTIFIDNQNFPKQLNKYMNIFKDVAIINYSVSFDSKVKTISIDRIPTLFDPAKKNTIIKKYLFISVFTILLIIISSNKINDISNALEINKKTLEKEKVTFNQLFASVKEKTLPVLPSAEQKEISFNKLIEKISNGELK